MREIVEAVFKATGVEALISDVERIKESVGGVGDKSKSMQDKFASAGDSMTSSGKKLTKGVTAPLALLAGGAIKTGVDYTNSMAKVQAISGNTADEMQDLEAIAREMGSTTRYSAGEAADGLGYMALAGWDNNQMISALPNVLNLATAGQMDLASASDIVTDMMSMFGMEADEATRATDIFAQAQASSNTSVDQLSEALGRAGPSANTAGHSMEETSAILGVFANQGLKGSAAGTALQAMYRDLQAGAEDGKVAIGESSIAIYDAEGNMRSMIDIMADFEGATEGMTAEQKDAEMSTIFQTQALRGASMVMNEGTDSAYELADSLENSSGAAQAQADIMDDTLGGSMAGLKSAAEEVAIQFFELAEGPLRNLVDGITNLVRWFGTLSPEMQQTIGIITLIVMAIGPVLIVLGKMATGVSALIGLWGKLSGAGSLLVKAFTLFTGPVGIAIAIIAGLIAIGVLLYKNWDTVKEKASQLHYFLQDVFQTMAEAIGNAVMAMVEWVVELFWSFDERVRGIAESIRNGVVEAFQRFDTRSREIVQGMRDRVVELFVAFDTRVREIVQGMKDKVVNTFVAFDTSVRNTVQAMRDAVVQFFVNLGTRIGEIITSIKNTAISIWNAIKNGIATVVNSILNTVTNIFHSIRRSVDTVMNTIRTVILRLWDTISSGIMKVLQVILGGVSGKFSAVYNYIQGAMNNIRTIISTILDFVRNTFMNVLNFIQALVTGNFAGMRDAISSQMSAIRNTISNIWNAIKSLTSNVFNAILSFIKTTLSSMLSSVTNILNRIKNFFSNIFNSLKGVVTSAFSNVVSSIRNGMNNGLKIVTGFASKFLNAGKNIVGSIASGIRSSISKATDAIGGVVSKVRNFLPFSPAKEGPLRDLNKLNFEGPIKDSINSAKRGVNRAMSSILDMPDVNAGKVGVDMERSAKSLETDFNYTLAQERQPKQPANLNLKLGDRTYKAFVEDISNQQGKDIDIAEAF